MSNLYQIRKRPSRTNPPQVGDPIRPSWLNCLRMASIVAMGGDVSISQGRGLTSPDLNKRILTVHRWIRSPLPYPPMRMPGARFGVPGIRLLTIRGRRSRQSAAMFMHQTNMAGLRCSLKPSGIGSRRRRNSIGRRFPDIEQGSSPTAVPRRWRPRSNRRTAPTSVLRPLLTCPSEIGTAQPSQLQCTTMPTAQVKP